MEPENLPVSIQVSVNEEVAEAIRLLAQQSKVSTEEVAGRLLADGIAAKKTNFCRLKIHHEEAQSKR